MKKWSLAIILFLCFTVLTACANNTKETVVADVTVTPIPATEEITAQETETQESETEESTTESTTETAAEAENQEKLTINIAALKGPTAIGMVKVMEDSASGVTANNYNFTIAGTADEITAGLVKGDYDIAAVPCNLASVLYNKTEGKITLAGINTLGVLYIVETGNTINSVEDLKGKTIYSTGLGTTPQYTLNYLLRAYGIDPEKDVTIEYKAESTEVAAILSEGGEGIAMLPQPYVTTVMMKNEKLRIALNVAKEWEAVSKDGSTVVTGVVVVRKDYLDKNKAAVDAFLNEYEGSAAFVNNQMDEAAALVEKFDIFKAAPTKKAIPYCGITLIRGEEMKEKVEGYLKALFDQNPKAVGGKLPDEDFFYLP